MKKTITPEKRRGSKKAIWLILPALLFGALTYLAVITQLSQNYDETSLLLVHDFTPDSFGHPLELFSQIFDPQLVIIYAVILGAIAFIFKKWREGLIIIGGVGAAAVGNIILKHVFSRPRPELWERVAETGFSFPSGHAMMFAAIATVIVIVLWRWSWCGLISTLLFAGTVVICFSRLYLGVHYPTDVAAGVCAGIFIAGFVASILASVWLEELFFSLFPKARSNKTAATRTADDESEASPDEIDDIIDNGSEQPASKRATATAKSLPPKRPLGESSRKKMQ